MKIAFLILAHRQPAQLQLLVDYLLRNECDVFVHIDRKSKRIFREFKQMNKGRKGLYVFSEYKVYWGGYNQIRATLFLLKKATTLSEFAFVSLLSGQDAPVKPLDQFRSYLAAHTSSSFISWHPVPAYENWADRGGLERVECYWITAFPRRLGFFFNRLNVLIHAAQRLLGIHKSFSVPLYGGANWFTLNREAAMYVAEYVSSNRRFLEKFRNTRCADEIILQTILMNSPLKDTVINDPLRFIDWSTGPEYPRTFRVDDTARLFANDAFFARKFDMDTDSEVLKNIYKRLNA